jgi:hypothetical protein
MQDSGECSQGTFPEAQWLRPHTLKVPLGQSGSWVPQPQSQTPSPKRLASHVAAWAVEKPEAIRRRASR